MVDDRENDYPPLSKEEIKEMKKIEKTLNHADNSPQPRVKHNLNVHEKQKIYTAITTRLEEFLDSYIVIAFDTKGNDYSIIKAPTAIDFLGLKSLAEKIMDKVIMHDLENDDDDD